MSNLAHDPISRTGTRHVRGLECCVVSSRKSPICRKAGNARVREVASDERPHVVQFLLGGLVFLGFLICQQVRPRHSDLSAEALLRLAERRRQVSETCSANDHHIHVTHRMFPASCHGTIDKSTLNIVPKRLKYLLQYRSQPCGFFEELLQVSEHRGLGLRLEISPCAFPTMHQYSACHQR